MDIIEFRDYCLSLPFAQETMPFGDNVLVFKVEGKIFAYSSIDSYKTIGLKCDPEYAIELRERYSQIGTSLNMHKKHWIGVAADEGLSTSFIKQLIKQSHKLVAEGLPKTKKAKVLEAIRANDN